MYKLLAVLTCCLAIPIFCFSQKRIAVIGSSTAAGRGTSLLDSSWVNLAKKYYIDLGEIDTIYNLAVPGTTSYSGMPNGFTPPPGEAAPDMDHNITKAISLNPDVIIISYPTNDVAAGIPMAAFLSNLRTMYSLITAAGKIGYVSTTQPRNDFTSNIVNKELALIEGRDSVLLEFPSFSLNFFDPLVDPNTANVGALNPLYDAGDHIHPNDAGHQLLFQVAKNNVVIPGVPLALVLTDFTAEEQHGIILLRWTSVNQDGPADFGIQRSGDGRLFNTIHSEAATEGEKSANYSWTDPDPLPGKNYYRLKITEENKDRYSGVLAIGSRSTTLIRKMTASGGNNLMVQINIERSGPMTVSVINTTGSLLYNHSYSTITPSADINVPISSIPAGVYFVKIRTADGDYETRPFTKF